MSPTATNPNILIFDSGVGGLSILTEIQQRLPGCNLVYASDNAAFPYGTKGEEDLVARVDKVLHQLLARQAIDIIVVACNSASTLALPRIRSRFAQPIVGVVPAIKPAAASSRTGVIGLLATPGTIARRYTRELIKQFACDNEVISLGSPELVTLAEQRLRGKPPCPTRLAQMLAPLQKHPKFLEMDTVVLACTHFPLLRQELSEYFGADVTLVDSGEAIARRVQYWVKELALAPGSQPEHCSALFTEDSPELNALGPALARFAIGNIRIDPLPFTASAP